MKPEEVAYIAGLIDGEGYIGIKKSKAYACQGRVTPGYSARICVKMVDEAAIRFLAETLGGWYYKEKRAAVAGRRILYSYQATEARAESILRAVLPFLRVKRRNAETVLALRELQRDGRKHRTKPSALAPFPNLYKPRMVRRFCFSDEYVAACESLYESAKRLNHAP